MSGGVKRLISGMQISVRNFQSIMVCALVEMPARYTKAKSYKSDRISRARRNVNKYMNAIESGPLLTLTCDIAGIHDEEQFQQESTLNTHHRVPFTLTNSRFSTKMMA